MKIGDKIKTLRKEKGLTQKALADASNISRSYLADVEGNRYHPSLDVVKAITKALNISMDEFFREENKTGTIYLSAYIIVIKKLREEKNLIPDELDTILGLPNGTISNIENGITKLSDDVVKKLCDFFDVQPNYIWGRTIERHLGEIDRLEGDYEKILKILSKASPEDRKKLIQMMEIYVKKDDENN